MRSVEGKKYDHIARMDRIITRYYENIKKVDENNELIELIDKYHNFKKSYFQPKNISFRNSIQDSIQEFQNKISKEILFYLQDIKKR